MRNFFRKFLACFTLMTILSSSAWAISPEVLLNEVFAKESVSQDMHLINKDHSHAKKDTKNHSVPDTCNHTCHSSAHLVGLVSVKSLIVNKQGDTDTFNAYFENQITSPQLQGLYRPPRTLSI